jgi:predicted hydrocarbon binding protein
MESENVPKTGRIGRFAKIIEKNLGEDLMLEVMQDSDKYKSHKAPEKATWWRSALERLEKKVGFEIAIEIMNQCGEKCCGQGIRKTAKRLMNESKSMEEFLEKASTYEVKEGEIEYKLKDKNTIIGIFNRCFCGQVKQTKISFKNKTYCQCSAEFHKQFFKAALEKPIEVELTQSIISGAKTCKFIIHIKEV